MDEVVEVVEVSKLGINELKKSHQATADIASIFSIRFRSNILQHLAVLISDFGLKKEREETNETNGVKSARAKESQFQRKSAKTQRRKDSAQAILDEDADPHACNNSIPIDHSLPACISASLAPWYGQILH